MKKAFFLSAEFVCNRILTMTINMKVGQSMRIFLGLFLVLLTVGAAATDKRVLPTMITMYQGESKVITAPDIVRMSVGQSKIVASTLLKNGEVVLTANEVGETNMQVWFANGVRESLPIVIVASNGWREAIEVKALLGDIPGIKIKTVGRQVVVDGNIEARDLERVNMVAGRFANILILAREITEFEQEMIYFDVQIAEFDRSKTEEVGINWQKSFAGPNLRYGKNWVTAGSGIAAWEAEDLDEGFHYVEGTRGVLFGMVSDITSVIDLLEQTGSGIVLASPRLSARSGGKADLTVGGEVPVITTSISGSSVEYKDYGVILGIEPVLDAYGNIIAHVSVAISQLDLAQAVDGQPAFKKRSTENDVKLKPGETLVLSGLITREEQSTYKKVKWLADIPILGHLFKSKSFAGGETEMVIFITPHVMGDLNSGVNKAVLDRVETLIEAHDFVMKEGLLE